MNNLLLEITTYDIPFELQTKAEEDLKSLLSKALSNLKLEFSPVISFSTNRRIVLYIKQMATEIKPAAAIKKGPSVSVAPVILEKFLIANNITLSDCYKENTSKGEFYFVKQTTKGGLLKNKLAEIIVKEVLHKITFKRSMFWNESKVKWPRPITNLVLMLGGEAIDFTFAGIRSTNIISGHMFLSEEVATLVNASDYFKVISNLKVVLPASGKSLQQFTISNNNKVSNNTVKNNAAKDDNKFIKEENLVAGDSDNKLSINNYDASQTAIKQSLHNDKAFNSLSLSREDIIINTVNSFANKHNLTPNLSSNLVNELLYLSEYPVVLFGEIPNKYLVLPKELLVNTMVKNQRYINFFNKDGTISKHFALVANIKAIDNGLEIIKGNQRVLSARLEDGLFFYKLDLKEDWFSKIDELKNITFFEKLGSMFDKQERLKQLAQVFFPKDDLQKLCGFSKVDLCSKVVGEFPELQGVMGYYYALNSGFSKEEALAIKEHYLPLSSNGELPSSVLGAKLAFLDKIDTLISFFTIGKAPTSSSDPFALRRAALGIIRICLQHRFNINLTHYLDNKLIEFLKERLIIYLYGLGVHKDITTAVLNMQNFNVVAINNRAVALSSCLNKNSDLITLFKRVFNILNGIKLEQTTINQYLLETVEEKELFKQLNLLQEKFPNFFKFNAEHIFNKNSLKAQEQVPLNSFNQAEESNINYSNYIEAVVVLKPYLDVFLNSTLIINPSATELTNNRLALLTLVLQALKKLGNLELINLA